MPGKVGSRPSIAEPRGYGWALILKRWALDQTFLTPPTSVVTEAMVALGLVVPVVMIRTVLEPVALVVMIRTVLEPVALVRRTRKPTRWFLTWRWWRPASPIWSWR